jgi:glycerol-3-phosphate dehydrogenase (NAD+)
MNLKITIFRGSAIARIVGVTTQQNKDVFNTDVKMWVYEEEVNGEKLSEIINTRHENVKYLPGKKLPENVRAVTDLVETCEDADIMIFVVPHQFVHRICDQLKGKLKQGVIAISLIKVTLFLYVIIRLRALRLEKAVGFT